MKAFNKILFMGLMVSSLVFAGSNFHSFTGTSASFSDTKHTSAEINAGVWDSFPSLIGTPENLSAGSENLQNVSSESSGTLYGATNSESFLSQNSSENNSSLKNESSFLTNESFLNNRGSAENLTNSSSNLTNNSFTAENEPFNLTNTTDLNINNNDLNRTASLEASNNTGSLGSGTGSGSGSGSGEESGNLDKDEGVLPEASFRSSAISGTAPLTVQFTDLSQNASEWQWDFGDGNNSTVQNPINTYSAAGTYTVNLTVNNENGTNMTLGTINVSEPAPGPKQLLPVANFTSNVSEGIVPLCVQFNDSSLNATALNWDFGDGANSTEQNLVHTYSAAGNYTAMLTVSNANGTNSTFTAITVLQPLLPVANFSSNITSGTAPLTVQFTDLSQNAEEWNWDFGDGAASTEQNPSHTYSAAGNYKVTLTVSDEDGSNIKTGEISVAKSSIDNSGNSSSADNSGNSSSENVSVNESSA